MAAGGAVYSRQSAFLALIGVGSFAILAYSQRHNWTPGGTWGAANSITLTRFILILSLFLTGESFASGVFVLAAGIAILVADAWDGWMARQRGETSEFGEYFDKESDAFFVLVLCLLAYSQHRVGGWILLPGLLRYVFVLALFALKPDLKKEYRSRWARVIYVCMVSALLGVCSLPDCLYSARLILATIALLLSVAQ
jgi:phosphatidylglycerophosphate synthase